MIAQPLFSVLIANYNNGKYLMEAIESVRQQTYTNWEIILVDDGSTDKSNELYKELEKDERIHIYLNEQNRGCTFTKAKCVELAKGVLCGFLDADDVLLTDALDVMAKVHIDPYVSIVSSRHEYVDDNFHTKGISRLLELKGKSYLENRDYGPEHFVSFKRKCYLQTKGLDISHRIGDDQELYLLLEEVGQWKVLDKVLYQYRVHPTSVGHTSAVRCEFWNMIARYEACVRRGLNPEDFPYRDYLDALQMERFSVSRLAIDDFRKHSKAYRLGKFLLRPFICLKRK